jgi:hypothetical protein
VHTIRTLVALDDDYRAYQDVIAVGIRILQPDTEVETADLETLEEAVKRFQPQVVICDQPESAYSGGWAIWVELSENPSQPTKVSSSGHYIERTNPTLQELLSMVDEVQQPNRPNNMAP